jgi:hypothetical protein
LDQDEDDQPVGKPFSKLSKKKRRSKNKVIRPSEQNHLQAEIQPKAKTANRKNLSKENQSLQVETKLTKEAFKEPANLYFYQEEMAKDNSLGTLKNLD